MSEAHQEALEELVHSTSLTSIEFHELHAARSFEAPTDDPAEQDPSYVMHMQTRIGESDLGVRVGVRVETYKGIIDVLAAADYSNAGPAPDDDVMERFATEVGVMAVVPYLRQAIADLSQRVLGESLLMPIIKREDVRSTKISDD